MSRVCIVLALWLLAGCKPAPPKYPSPPRDLAMAQQPWDGEYVMHDEMGEIVQRTVWNDHKLIEAWGVSKTSPDEWKQVVKTGTGVIRIYGRLRKHAGFNWFENGEFVRGAG